MRSAIYKPEDILFATAKKKPRIQVYLDKLSEMTVEEIDKLSEAIWIRKALLDLKKHNGVPFKKRLELFANEFERLERINRAAPLPTYEVRIWHGSDQAVECGSSGHMTAGINIGLRVSIDIQNGDPLMIYDDSAMRVGSSYVKTDWYHNKFIRENSKLVGYMNYPTYGQMVQDLLKQKYGL